MTPSLQGSLMNIWGTQLSPEKEFGGQNFCPSCHEERNGSTGLSSDFSDSQSGRIRTRTQDSCLKTRPHWSQLSMLVSLCHNWPTACLEGAAIGLCQTQATNPALSREPDIVPPWMAHRPHHPITRNAPFPGAKVPRWMQKSNYSSVNWALACVIPSGKSACGKANAIGLESVPLFKVYYGKYSSCCRKPFI